MALSATRLVTPTVSSAAGLSVTTAPFTGLANEDLIVRCFVRSGTTVTFPEITNSAGLTFALLGSAQHNPVVRQRIWRVNLGASPPTNMTVTCTVTGTPQGMVLEVLGQRGSSGDYSNIGTATSTVGDVTVVLPVAPAADSIVIGFFGQALGSDLAATPTGYTVLSTNSPVSACRAWVGYDPAPASDTVLFDSQAVDTRRSVGQLLEVKNAPSAVGSVTEPFGLSTSFAGRLAAGRSDAVTLGLEMVMSASVSGDASSPENPAGTWRSAVRTWPMPSGIDPIAGDNLTFSSGGGGDPLWYRLPIRSGRPFASGTSIWYDRRPPDDLISAAERFAAEEADVALIDGIAGSSKGDGRAHVATMNLVFGRTSTGADDFIDTQFDWRVIRPFFGIANGLAHMPVDATAYPQGSGWIFWVIQFVPTDRTTEGGAGGEAAGDPSIWTEYANGTHDALLLEFGDRFRRKVDATGHPRERFIIDAHHEMNQSNSFQVYPGTRTLYKNAMTRIIAKVREGAGYHVRFCHRPAYRIDPGDAKVGPYNSFIPDGIDILALSVHPAADCDTSAKVDQLFAGTLNSSYYGTDELIATAGAMNLPIAFPEWSPRYDLPGGGACPVANTFYQKFYNNVLVPNQDILVFDGVWNQNVRDLGAYEGTQPGGSAQWDLGVQTRKTLFSGLKSGTSEFVLVHPKIGLTRSGAQLIRPTDGQLRNNVPGNANQSANHNFSLVPGFTSTTNATLDLRGKKFYHHSLNPWGGDPTPAQVSAIRPDNYNNGMCIYGAEIIGQQPDNTVWRDMKVDTNPAVAMDDNAIDFQDGGAPADSTVYIEACVLRKSFDGVNTDNAFRLQPANKVRFIVRGCYGEKMRDEFIENDGLSYLEVYDCLVDSCHNFVSMRPGSSSDAVPPDYSNSANWVKCYNVLSRCRGQYYTTDVGGDTFPFGTKRDPQWEPNNGSIFVNNPTTYGPGWVHREPWKGNDLETFTNVNATIWVDCRDSIFAFESFPSSRKVVFPPGTYSNVFLLYLPDLEGSGEFSTIAGLVDSRYVQDRDITVLAGAAARTMWDRERSAWIAAHGGSVVGGLLTFPFTQAP